MKKSLFSTGLRALATTSVFMPGFVGVVLAAPPESLPQVQSKLCEILGWMYTLALIVGVLCIILAAITYMASRGNSEKVGEANKALTYAIIGIVIAFLATSVPAVLGSILGSADVNNCP